MKGNGMHHSVRQRAQASSRIGSLDRLVGYLLRRAEIRIINDLSESLLPLGLRPSTFTILVVVAENPKISQSQVCEILNVKHANFVALASELEAAKFLRREPSPADRRQLELGLTADGARMLKRAWRIVDAQEARLLRALGASASQQFQYALRTLIADFEAVPADM